VQRGGLLMPYSCSEQSWHECLFVLDLVAAKKPMALIDRGALRDVLQCAREADQIIPQAMVYKVRAGAKRQAVDTALFKNFIHEHAAVCGGKGKSNAA
jgi:hypothetical protein